MLKLKIQPNPAKIQPKYILSYIQNSNGKIQTSPKIQKEMHNSDKEWEQAKERGNIRKGDEWEMNKIQDKIKNSLEACMQAMTKCENKEAYDDYLYSFRDAWINAMMEDKTLGLIYRNKYLKLDAWKKSNSYRAYHE